MNEVEGFYPSVEDCITWLENKWARHKELEDKASGEYLVALRARVAEAERLIGEFVGTDPDHDDTKDPCPACRLFNEMSLWLSGNKDEGAK